MHQQTKQLLPTKILTFFKPRLTVYNGQTRPKLKII